MSSSKMACYAVGTSRPAIRSRGSLLYGENGKPLYGVNPDAIYADDDGDRALLEIEGGGAVQNNRLMKSDETAMPEPYPLPRSNRAA